MICRRRGPSMAWETIAAVEARTTLFVYPDMRIYVNSECCLRQMDYALSFRAWL